MNKPINFKFMSILIIVTTVTIGVITVNDPFLKSTKKDQKDKVSETSVSCQTNYTLTSYNNGTGFYGCTNKGEITGKYDCDYHVGVWGIGCHLYVVQDKLDYINQVIADQRNAK